MADKILVVDDDPETVRIFQLFLQRLGYETFGALGGPQAIELARKEMPDLIILDVMMPGMDGFEVAQNLHRLPETSLIPILMVTARSGVEDKSRGYDAGADIYLTKPVHQLDLAANIKTLLSQRKARQVALSQQGYLLGVMAVKGGLGVSTVALNLAVAYARKFKQHSIAAELRPGQGTWADELNLPPTHALGNLLKMNPLQITQAVVEGQLSNTSYGTRLLLASSLAQEPTFHTEPAQYEAILTALDGLAPLIVLDIGTYFSDAVPAILARCSEVLVVCEPQALAVKQTCRLIDLLRKQDFGTFKPLTVVSLNHARSDTSLTVSQMESILDHSIMLGFTPALELAAYAQKQYLPICIAQPESITTQQFNRLAEAVVKHMEGMNSHG